MPMLEKLSEVWPALKLAGLAPQVPVTEPATVLMLLSVSVNAPPLRAVEALLFDSVRVTTEVPPGAIEAGLKALAMVGAASTVRVAVLLATLKITVQLLPAGMPMLEKLSEVWPALKLAGLAPQVPVTDPATVLMLLSVSVNAPPLRAVEALLLASVRVTTEVPPVTIEAGLKALAMVGAASTVRVAVLLAAPAVGVCVVVMPEVVLLLLPGVPLVTPKITVQLPPAGMAMLEKLSDVWPALKLAGLAPQVPVTEDRKSTRLNSSHVKISYAV